MARTFVVKLRQARAAVEWASVMTMAGHGADAVAVVNLYADDPDLLYIVITGKPVRVSNQVAALKRKLEDPPLNAQVEWVRPFSRRLQRLFGWGDSWVSPAEVERAVEEDNKPLLLKALPTLKACIELGERITVSTSPVAALTNSSHQEEAARQEHEERGAHKFGEPDAELECSLCNAFPAARCECGAQRCSKCALPPRPPHHIMWKQSSAPAPFFVQEQGKMRKEEQVEWLQDELGRGASLTEFAALYRELLAGKVKGDVQQRLHCLELYRLYNPDFTAKKECELHPPEELEAFQRVFDPKAPARCRWCASAVPPDGPYATYCSNKCHAAAHPAATCPKCSAEDLMWAPVNFCYLSKAFAKCRRCSHLWQCALVHAPYDSKAYPAGGEPAYKARRRS
jgi:hypothetical protein